jgi:nickel-dependent lactate racemase
VQLPSGTVAIGVGSRGVGGIGPIVAALVQVLKEAGAEPFVVPAMGSHGASTAEGQAEVLRHLGVSEEEVGCHVRATMETTMLGETPSGVEVFMDRNAYEADAVILVNRVKPHTAFRGGIESGPTKMLTIGLGKQNGAHSVHSAGWENIHRTILEAAQVAVESGKVAFGLAVLENPDEKPYKVVAIPAGKLEEGEALLLEEAKKNLLRLPFDVLDVLVVDEIGKKHQRRRRGPERHRPLPHPLRYRRPRGPADGLSGPDGGDRRQRQRRRDGRRGVRVPRLQDGSVRDLP